MTRSSGLPGARRWPRSVVPIPTAVDAGTGLSRRKESSTPCGTDGCGCWRSVTRGDGGRRGELLQAAPRLEPGPRLQFLAGQLAEHLAHFLVLDAFQLASLQLTLHLVQLVLELWVRRVELSDLLIKRMPARVGRHDAILRRIAVGQYLLTY